MNPECSSGHSIEVHHITPKKQKGCDEYWNFIILCRACHRSNGYHKNWEDNKVTLLTWKCFFEITKLGFFLDEQDSNYYERVKSLVLCK